MFKLWLIIQDTITILLPLTPTVWGIVAAGAEVVKVFWLVEAVGGDAGAAAGVGLFPANCTKLPFRLITKNKKMIILKV